MESDEITLLNDDSVLKYVKMVSNPLNLKPEDVLNTTKVEYETLPLTYAPKKRKPTNYVTLDHATASKNALKHNVKRSTINKRIQPTRKAKEGVIYVQKSGEDYVTELGNNVDAELIKEIFDNEEVEKDEFDDNSRRNIGFIIEDYIAEHLPCPYCKNKSLRSYVRKNMATVDLICISEDHDINNWPIFFQVKASHMDNDDNEDVIMGSMVNGYPYFVLNNSDNKEIKNTILTGSYREGNIIHRINIDSSMREKMLLMAYICIGYRDVENGYEILPNKSFMVLPIQRRLSTSKQLFHDIEDNDDYYFRVIEENGNKTLIEFSKQNNRIESVPQYTIPFDYKGIWTYGNNPRRTISLENDIK